ncbi:hypothetical protein BB561_005569 [Smittium simulii]|uniref:Flavodoxin-like domain-containing protein n=1 Tax=Smittium simulii TaxID=133385 RepID=A0A2T9Y9R3_9FUNG|nr:hypothetical protein BB561_005569 [Smittium simulii]
MSTKPVIYVIYYSMYGHIATLGDAVLEGLHKNDNVDVKTFVVPETLSEQVLEKMNAPPKREDVPIISPEDLPKADAYMFGLPTRFGTPPAQFKAFWDSTGQLWQNGELCGKMAATFFSTASQSGGQESTVWSMLPNLAHHQMLFVPLGYAKAFAQLTDNSQVSGGSAYGSGTIAGSDGSRQPSENELDIARIHGEYFASTVAQYHAGKLQIDAAAAAISEQNAKQEDTLPQEASADHTADAAKTDEPEAPPLVAAVVAEDSSKVNKRESKLKKMMKRISRIF